MMKKMTLFVTSFFALLLLSSCASGAPAPEPGMNNSETVLGIIPEENVHGIDGGAFTGHESETILGIISKEAVESLPGVLQ